VADPAAVGERILDGPILRRILGKALVERFCPFGRPLCEDPENRAAPSERCDLAEVCPYGVLFAGSLTGRPPFALFVPLRHAGPVVPVELTLFGPAVRVFAWAIEAVVTALAAGVGALRRPYRVIRVEAIHADGARTTLCQDGTPLPTCFSPETLVVSDESVDAETPVIVDFLSPTRLKTGGRLLMGPGAPPFAVLVARILDRYRDLFGDGADPLVPRSLRGPTFALAARIEAIYDEVEWVEVDDYSARKAQEMQMGGKVGRVVYGPGAGAFVPILRLGEILHVGKNAASGCGRIAVYVGGPAR